MKKALKFKILKYAKKLKVSLWKHKESLYVCDDRYIYVKNHYVYGMVCIYMKGETKKNILNSLIYFIKTFFFLCCYIGFCIIVVQLGI